MIGELYADIRAGALRHILRTCFRSLQYAP